jgi:hypothetical protein
MIINVTIQNLSECHIFFFTLLFLLINSFSCFCYLRFFLNGVCLNYKTSFSFSSFLLLLFWCFLVLLDFRLCAILLRILNKLLECCGRTEITASFPLPPLPKFSLSDVFHVLYTINLRLNKKRRESI